ncbi:MAG: cob(I)yrinic acid a,c-diamide adenosyltransferase [Hyphomicrobiales bacterium]
MTKQVNNEAAERHRAKMAKRKEVQDEEVAGKTLEKGLLIVHTGTGKGKSTAAFGLALRMLGRGKRIGVVQFVKGAWHTAERDALANLWRDQVAWHSMGEGSPGRRGDLARDVAAAERAWAKARASGRSELRAGYSRRAQYCARYDYLPLDEVIATLKNRRSDLHGRHRRNAKPDLIEAADLVTDMTLVKHHSPPA